MGKRSASEMEMYGPQKIYSLINLFLETPRDKAFVATLWVTGSRVSEIVKNLKVEQIAFRNIKGKKFVQFQHLPVLKKRKYKGYKRNVLVPESDSNFLEILLDRDLYN